ncbi:MAG: ATP-binding protein [Bacteroidota bacterium]
MKDALRRIVLDLHTDTFLIVCLNPGNLNYIDKPQSAEAEKFAKELAVIKEELLFENNEKAKRAAELVIANTELAFQNSEKTKRAAELMKTNRELIFQNEEKEKRAAELIVANRELAFQNKEKENRANELMTANAELKFQNEEKEKRAAELIIANEELAYQNEEKGKRANELMAANVELKFQNEEKEKRAAELIIANEELAYQNEEKGKRAAELIIANVELAYQNEEKEKRANELGMLNKELEQFAYIASHDLQQPLRTVSNYMRLFEDKYLNQLDENAGKYIHSANNAVKRMSSLINSLLTFSQLGNNRKLASVDLKKLLDNVIDDHGILIKSSNTIIEISEMPVLNTYEIEMYQLFQNLITNSIKFQKGNAQPKLSISATEKNGKWQFAIKDNGIGIEPMYHEKIFDIFQRLHGNKEYEGSGIGLANCKKIVQLHQGEIWLESELNEGAVFYFTIPNLTL